jgi:hypothetical protein
METPAMPLSATARAALELRFDGAIPAHLLCTETQAELEAGHHVAMIRFYDVRIDDFTASLNRLLAGPQGPGIQAWIDRTRGTINDHLMERAKHAAALTAADLGLADEGGIADCLGIAAE